MTTLKNPPAGPPITVERLQGGELRITVTPAWLHWFTSIKTTQSDNVADAETAHDVTGADTVDQSDLEDALDALGTKINSIFDILETIKAMAES